MTVVDSLFSGNSANNNGVLTVMDSDGMLDGNMAAVVHVNVSSSRFENNFSGSQGACISIGSFIQLSRSSAIRNCSFESNESGTGSAINFAFQTGDILVHHCTFTNSTAGNGAAVFANHFPTEQHLSMVRVQHCLFQESNMSPTLTIQGYSSMNTLEMEFCVFRANRATALRITTGYIIDRNSIYEYQESEESGVVYIEVFGQLDIINMTAHDNHASTYHGGVFFACVHSILNVYSSWLYNNYAGDSGGVLYCDENSYCSLYDTKMNGNTAGKIGSTLYVSPGFLVVSNCSIHDNYAARYATVILTRCFANITDTYFANNTCGEDSPGIVLSSSYVSIINSRFEDQQGRLGAFILGIDHNSVEIRDSVFLRGSASSLGGAIYTSVQSNVTITSSQFFDCSSVGEAGAIMSVSSSLVISDSSFVRNSAGTKGGCIGVSEGTLVISSTLFQEFGHGAVYCEASYLVKISNTQFTGGSNDVAGAAMFVLVTDGLLIDNTFVRNSGMSAGAVDITGSSLASIRSLFTLRHNRFLNNTAEAEDAGALRSANADLYVEQNIFQWNSAASSIGRGGAVVLLCDSTKWCNVTLSGNELISNRAGSAGGAVFWQGAKPLMQDNHMKDNTAPYGDDIASYPVTMAAVSDFTYIEPIDNSGVHPVLLKLVNVPSGQLMKVPMRIGLFDGERQLVKADNSSSALLAAANSSVLTISGNVISLAAEGVFTFTEYTIVAPPGTTQYIQITTNAIDETKRAIAKDTANYHATAVIQVDLRPCTKGESLQGDTCFLCAEGTYSLDPTLPCMLCPSAAICYGNSTMVPKSGFWRIRNDTDQFIECLSSDACIGSLAPPSISETGLCADGYLGNLCQLCKPGFSRTGRFNCARCPGEIANIAVTSLLCLGALGLLAIVIYTAIRSAQKAQSLIAIYAKIFMNYLQMVVVSSSLNLNWPSFVRTFLGGQQIAGAMAEQLFSFECLLSDFSVASSEMYYTKVQLTSALPIGLFLFIAGGWLAISLCGKMENKGRKMWASAVIVLFVLHPTITKVMFSLFSCMDLGDGHLWLINDLALRCWDSIHLQQILCVAVPSIFIWVIGLPALTLGFLVRRRIALDHDGMKLMFCFLYKGYHRTRFYWEFVILYRKVALIAASVFLSSISIKVQSLTVLAILLVSLVTQVQIKPFFDVSLNTLEAKSIIVSAITIYSGLYYATNDISTPHTGFWLKVVFFIVILCANGYFLLSWLRMVSPVLLKTLREKLNSLLRYGKHYRVRDVPRQPEGDKLGGSSVFSSDVTNPRGSMFEDPVDGHSSELRESIYPVPINTPVADREYTEREEAPAAYTLRE